MTLTSNTGYAYGIGRFKIDRQGRRVLLSQQESDIRYWEEIAFARAENSGRAHYVVMDWNGRIFSTHEPYGLTILRICPVLS